MRRTTKLLNLAAAFAAASLVFFADAPAARAQEAFALAGHSVEVDNAASTATFRLTFNREPVFFVSEGTATDAFQVEIDGDSTSFDQPLLFDTIDAVVRGAEISQADGLPIRDREGDGGEGSGGWGPVRGFVPFDLDGDTISFTTAWSLIGDDDGKFRYRIIAIDDGSVTSEVTAAIIPVPAALWGGAIMLSSAGLLHKLRGRSFR